MLSPFFPSIATSTRRILHFPSRTERFRLKIIVCHSHFDKCLNSHIKSCFFSNDFFKKKVERKRVMFFFSLECVLEWLFDSVIIMLTPTLENNWGGSSRGAEGASAPLLATTFIRSKGKLGKEKRGEKQLREEGRRRQPPYISWADPPRTNN